MSLAFRLRAEEIRELAFGSIGGSYTIVGTTFEHGVRILYIQNLTDETLMFSFNGTIDQFVIPGNGFLVLDVTANQVQDQGCFIGIGQGIYVKDIGTPPTVGSVYVSAFFASRD